MSRTASAAAPATAPARPARIDPKRSRKAGPLIMVMCLLLAVLAVLFVPALVGGAQVAASSSTLVARPAEAVRAASYEEAAQILGYAPALPAIEGATARGFSVLDGTVLEVEYEVGKASLVYRTGPGNEDLSYAGGEYAYSVYETTEDVARTYEGASESRMNLAIWAADGYSYAVVAAEGIDGDALRAIAESIG